MPAVENARLSVTLIDVGEGHEAEFLVLAERHQALLQQKGYGHAQTLPDEAIPSRFYSVRYWKDAASAERCHADADLRDVTARIDQIASIRHVVNGARKPDPLRLMLDERRMKIESDRRMGFERRAKDTGRREGERRAKRNRRLGPRRLQGDGGETDLVGAARRARQHADVAFSKFAVGAALLTADGAIVTGCNIENATYGLTMCAERVALFKALSEGHRAFTRIAIVADTSAPASPCGACRQLLWEFGGNLEIVLANLQQDTGTHRLKDLLPLPFDARLL